MPSLDEVIAAICRMPLDHRGEVTVEHLYECLAKDPRLIDAWQVWSDDNRSTPAWVFGTLGPNEFEVRHFDRSGSTTVRLRFEDRGRACAEYMLRNLETLADDAEVWLRPWISIRERLARLRQR